MTNKISVSSSQLVWRVCNLFMSLFFALATYVQVNNGFDRLSLNANLD